MNMLRQAWQAVCDRLVSVSPRSFLNSLRKNHFDDVAREFNRPHAYAWSQFVTPPQVDRFEDLVALFALSPLNRGIIRQDFDEAAALFRVVRGMESPCGIEIGRFSGGSTLLLAAAVGAAGKVVSIDIAPQDDASLERVLHEAQLSDRVELIVADANAVERTESFDFAFIDADHSYQAAKRDHNRWGRRVRSGGFLIHHDMGSGRALSTQWADLARLRSEILACQRQELELVEEAGSMTIFRRTSDSWTEIEDHIPKRAVGS